LWNLFHSILKKIRDPREWKGEAVYSMLLDDSPGGLVDTVKELTDILLLNLGSLLDLRNRGTNSLDGVADKPDFILFRGPVDLDALLHVDAEGNL